MRFKAKACVGCQICTLVCSLHHEGQTSLIRGKIKIERKYPSLEDPIFKAYFCRQCSNAKCIEACETNALYQDEEKKMVTLDQEKCNSCGKCIHACPFHAIWLNPYTQKAFKCNLCDGNPVCIKYCPHEALSHQEDTGQQES